MEAGAHLEQAADPAAHHDLPLGRRRDLGEDLQERALARPIAADDADRLSRLNGEVHVPEGPELVPRCALASGGR